MGFAPANSAETIIFRYPPRLDVFQQPIPGSGRDVAVDDCVFAPGPGDESDVQARQAQADATVYAPPESPALSAQDQIVARGDVYDVIEPPRYWQNEVWEIPVRRVTG